MDVEWMLWEVIGVSEAEASSWDGIVRPRACGVLLASCY